MLISSSDSFNPIPSKLNSVVQHHEKQIVEMSSHIRNLEEYLSRSRQEMSALTAALDGARELNSKLQSTADQSTREIALQINQSQKQETASEELRQEIGQLLNRLNQSEEAIFTLESAIRKLREENFEKEVLQVNICQLYSMYCSVCVFLLQT